MPPGDEEDEIEWEPEPIGEARGQATLPETRVETGVVGQEMTLPEMDVLGDEPYQTDGPVTQIETRQTEEAPEPSFLERIGEFTRRHAAPLTMAAGVPMGIPAYLGYSALSRGVLDDEQEQAFDVGAQQSSTLGFGDEIEGALMSLAGGEGEAHTQSERDLSSQLQEAHPYATGAGGMMGGQYLAGALPAGGATAGARLGLGLGGGALMGGIEGYGRSEGEDTLQDVAEGTVAGGVGGLVGAGIGEGLGAAGRGLMRNTDQARLEATGLYGRGARSAIERSPFSEEQIAAELRRTGAGEGRLGIPDMRRAGPEIDEAASASGRGVRELAQGLSDEGATVDPQAYRAALEGLAEGVEPRLTTGPRTARGLRSLAGEIPEDAGPVPFFPQWEDRVELDRLLRHGADPSMATVAGQRSALAGIARGQLQESAEGVGRGPEWANALRQHSLNATIQDAGGGGGRLSSSGGMGGGMAQALGIGLMASGTPGGGTLAALGRPAMQELRMLQPGLRAVAGERLGPALAQPARTRAIELLLRQLRAAQGGQPLPTEDELDLSDIEFEPDEEDPDQ